MAARGMNMDASRRRSEATAQCGGPPSETVTKRTKRLIVGEFGWPILDDGRPSNKFSRATASRCGLSARSPSPQQHQLIS